MPVVDASVALKWVLDEPGSDEARRLLPLAPSAPAHWLVECANALSRRAREGEITPDEALHRLDLLRRAGVRLIDPADLLDAALALSLQLRHPIYDCLYLAQAVRERSEFVTADAQFVRTLAAHPELCPHVSLLGA